MGPRNLFETSQPRSRGKPSDEAECAGQVRSRPGRLTTPIGSGFDVFDAGPKVDVVREFVDHDGWNGFHADCFCFGNPSLVFAEVNDLDVETVLVQGCHQLLFGLYADWASGMVEGRFGCSHDCFLSHIVASRYYMLAMLTGDDPWRKAVSRRYHIWVSGDVSEVRDLFERIANLLRSASRDTADGLQPVQVQVLQYLDRCNRYSDGPAAVAEFLGITKGTASQTINVLQRRDLIDRQLDRGDKRRVHLRLTHQGAQIAEAASSPTLLGQALAELPGGPTAAKDMLAQVLTLMQRQDGLRGFGVCATCRHFRRSPSGDTCGLTAEPLSASDAELLCREYETSN